MSLTLTLEPHRNTRKDLARAFLSHPGQRGRTRAASAPMPQLPQCARQGLRAPGSLKHGLSLAAHSAAHCRQRHGCLGTGGQAASPQYFKHSCPVPEHLAHGSRLPASPMAAWELSLAPALRFTFQFPRSYGVPTDCQGGPFLPITAPLLRSYGRAWEAQRREVGCTHAGGGCGFFSSPFPYKIEKGKKRRKKNSKIKQT